MQPGTRQNVTLAALIHCKKRKGTNMRKLLLAFSAASMVATALVPIAPVEARKSYQYREWRGRDGRTYCRRSNGTTGLVVGGVAGALVGNGVAGRGDKTLGTIVGGVAGAFGGQAIDKTITKKRRCR
jgi:uncharacterized protein YcfJ